MTTCRSLRFCCQPAAYRSQAAILKHLGNLIVRVPADDLTPVLLEACAALTSATAPLAVRILTTLTEKV